MKIKWFMGLAVLSILLSCGANPPGPGNPEALVTELEKTWKDFQAQTKTAQTGDFEAYGRLKLLDKKLTDLWARKEALEKSQGFTPQQLQRLSNLGQTP